MANAAKGDKAAPEFRELVAIIDPPKDDEAETATLNELISGSIAQANRDGRHADSAALHQLSVRLGDLRIALRDARPVASGALADALAVLADLI